MLDSINAKSWKQNMTMHYVKQLFKNMFNFIEAEIKKNYSGRKIGEEQTGIENLTQCKVNGGKKC